MFSKELSYIKSNEIKAFTELVLSIAPQKFFVLPASSTQKYHPDSSNGRGGLVVHSKQVFWIAKAMMDTNLQMFDVNRDVVLSSCLLHDIFKYDPDNKSNYTVRNHGIKGKQFIENSLEVQEFFSVYSVHPTWFKEILGCVHAHNGLFTQEYQGHFSAEQSIVHAADWIAAQRWCYFDQMKLT